MKLSIVTTMYRSGPYLEEFYARICAAAGQVTTDFEIVLVNDGCPENSLDVALAIYERDPRVRIVDLSRNFGHHKAMMVGLSYAAGDLVFLIDCDLEEPPETLTRFYPLFQEKKQVDVIFGVQQQVRTGAFFNRLTGSLYYRIFNWLAAEPIESDQLTARLMTRRYVQALLMHKEHSFSIEGLWHITGFQQLPVQIKKADYKGTTSYTLSRRLKYMGASITAFSNRPLIFIAEMGGLITAVTGLFLVYILIQYFIFHVSVEGWTSLIVSLWFLAGVILLALGVISIYLAVIFVEVKQRPYAIVRKVYDEQHRNERKSNV